MPKLLITGGNGFIGKQFVEAFKKKFDIRATSRSRIGVCKGIQHYKLDLKERADWSNAVEGIDVVIHTAAMVHLNQKSQQDENESIFEVNCNGTARLAEQAVLAGVKRFIFISSIGVNGTTKNEAFSETDDPRPDNAYAKSKFCAEKELWRISNETGLQVVIIRPPLVYGPNAPGNFRKINETVNMPLLLPFGGIHNKRSFLYVKNLGSLVEECISHHNAANEVFLASDKECLSTPQFFRLIYSASEARPRVVWFPETILRFILGVTGNSALTRQLIDSSYIDISKAKELLGWTPPFTIEEGIRDSIRSEGGD